MCAISGIVGLPWDQSILERLLKTMRRRGPDGEGIYENEDAALLHTRLAIIDPQGGAQPMELTKGEETYIITYNGELYNTEEVRSALIRKGWNFRGHSDTEVVLTAFAQWGEECLPRLNGIFAFAIWEKRRGRLFMARDRMGVKPLFYAQHQGGLLFASEIKTILEYPTMQARLDEQGAVELIMLGPGRTPGNGVFFGIEEILPGWCGWYERGRLRCKPYWTLRDREHTQSFPETAETVRELVLDAIKSQMVSDVPIGTFLSGGLDSSLISAVCAKECRDKGERLKTFSVDYENNEKFFVPGKFQPNSDTGFIRIMLNSISADHHWSILTPEMLLAVLEDATEARDLPGMADVDFSLHTFCAEIRGHVKVALSGECADEIFGGYPWYRDPQVRAIEGFPWAQNTMQRQRFLRKDILDGIDAAQYVKDLYSDTIRSADILPGTSAQEKRMKEMVVLNQKWFMQTLLDRKDRMSMYHGLEVRVPFCDYRIAEYLYGVPWEYKDYHGFEKGLLRKAMEGILPSEILWRKKSPYPKTHDPRYLELVSDRLRAVLNDPAAPIHDLVSKKALEGLLTAEYIWPWYGQLMQVPQTIAYMLQINYWLSHYHVSLM